MEFHGIRAESAIDALAIAASNGSLKEIQLLLDDGIGFDGVAAYSKETPLASAAGSVMLKAVNFLIEKGANIGLPSGYQMTPLMNACHIAKAKGSKAALRLIETGADVNYVREEDEMTALKFAVTDCKPEVVQALIDRGAEMDRPEGTDQTALMIAARENNVDSLKVLVENGAETSLPCKLGWAKNRTALGLAVLEKREKAMEY